MEVVLTVGTISCAKLHSNCHHQETNTQFFTSWLPFLSPNRQCQSTDGKISHFMDLLTPTSRGGLPTFLWPLIAPGVTWGRVAMPQVASPLMPVPQVPAEHNCNSYILPDCWWQRMQSRRWGGSHELNTGCSGDVVLSTLMTVMSLLDCHCHWLWGVG